MTTTGLAVDLDVAAYALRLGDDALVLGQRLAEWAALAPQLEQDVALLNLALDLLGLPPGERQGDPILTEADPEALAELARGEVAELEGLKADSLDELDAEDRALAEQGLGDDASPEAQQLFRYEAA